MGSTACACEARGDGRSWRVSDRINGCNAPQWRKATGCARPDGEKCARGPCIERERLDSRPRLSGTSTVLLREVDVCVPYVAIWLASYTYGLTSKRSGRSPELVRHRWDARLPDFRGIWGRGRNFRFLGYLPLQRVIGAACCTRGWVRIVHFCNIEPGRPLRPFPRSWEVAHT